MAKMKSLSKMTIGDIVTATATAGSPMTGAATKWANDTYKGKKSDAKAKSDARDDAANAQAAEFRAKYDAERAIGRSPLERIANATVPGVTAAALDPRFRDSQISLLDQLTAQSQGKGPSLAQMQFQQAGNTALQKSMGAIRAATGSNAALAGRTAALASTNMLGNLAAESGMMRLKEQQDAQSALATLASAGRTGDLQSRQQDIGLGVSNADIAIRNAQVQAAAAGGLLDETGRKFEGDLNRQAQMTATKSGGGADPLMSSLIGAGGAILAAKAGGPAAAPAGAAAGQAIAGAGGRGGIPLVASQQKQKRPLPGQYPFGKMGR